MLVSCQTGDPARPVSEAVSSASAPPASPALAVDNELEASGVRVRSGTLPSADARALWGFTDLAIDARRARLQIELAKGGAPLEQLLPPGGLAVVNGGYYEPDFRPSTWLKNAGIELAPRRDTTQGGVLALSASRVYLGPFSGLSFEPELAVQSFPLVVEPSFQPGIRRDDGRRAARTLACLVESNLHFILISAPRGEGPTLFELMAWLRAPAPHGFGCRVALNLDGGPSSGVWFAPHLNARQRPPLAPVAYAIAIVPR